MTASSPSGASAQQGNGTRMELGGAVQASPFDRLPDELLSAILSFVRPLSSLSKISINKRFLRLGQPLWTVSVTPEHYRQPSVLQAFNRRPDLQLRVQTVSAHFPDEPDVFSYECTIYHLFRNLKSLDLGGSFLAPRGGGAVYLEFAFTDALRSLTSLRQLSLVFYNDVELEDDTFSLGKDLPRLEDVTIRSAGHSTPLLPQLLETPCPSVRRLNIEMSGEDTDAFSTFPWQSLVVLGLALPSNLVNAQAFLSSFEQALDANPSLPLSHLALGNRILGSKHPIVGFGTSSANTVQLFDLFRRARIDNLELGLALDALTPPDILPLPSVQTLVLRGPGVDCSSTTLLLTLTCLLDIFPSSARLTLHGFTFGSKAIPDALKKAAPPSSSFFLARPTLLTFLHYLRETRILEFNWIPDRLVRYRWCRQKGGDEFEAETFRPFWAERESM
ncbi:hypothetical protein JCM6882_000422 [Rhodosporidiobolus microsporus]